MMHEAYLKVCSLKLIICRDTQELNHFDMVTFKLPHTNLARLYKNYDIFGKHMKVPDAIEQSYIYFIMALRKYFDMVTKKIHHTLQKTRLGKSKAPKAKKCKGRFRLAPSRDRISFSSYVKVKNDKFKFISGSFFFRVKNAPRMLFYASGSFNIGIKWVKVGYAI